MNAEKKRKADEIYKRLSQGLIQTVEVLDSDIRSARLEWQKAKDSQFWRRTLLRCCCASVEGAIGLLKQVTPKCADYFEIILTESDLKIVTERRTWVENGIVKSKPAFLPFRDNFKETFKVFAKAHNIPVAADFNASGFADLCQTFEVRNRLMHPKTVFDLEVNDDDLNQADQGLKWFGKALTQLLDECGEKSPFLTKAK